MDFKLPALGEGIDSATVVGILVKPGDAVSAGQSLVSVETDKAAVDVPAEADATVEAVLVKAGDKVPVGASLLRFSVASKPPTPTSPTTTTAPKSAATSPPAPPTAAPSVGQQAEFKLPALGEGIDAATVVSVAVKPGDTVTAGQTLVAVETDKAAVDIPAESDGTVKDVRVKAGDKVPVGGVLFILTGGVVATQPAANTTIAVVAPIAATSPPVSQAPVNQPAASVNGHSSPKTLVPAGPATRRLARELGVALADVKPTGRQGRVTLDDVKGHVKTRLTQAPVAGTASGSVVDAFMLPPLPDFARYGEVERKPVSNIRKKIAENLTVAWRTMPMVTQHELADITELEAGRKRIVDGLPKGSPKVTMTVLAVKAVVAALKEFPHFNSSYDMNAGVLVTKKYFHIGIAVDTERGLVVPVIRDADRKTIRDLATEVVVLADKARTGKLAVDEMRGGTFTITNLGGIGGTAFTPIVNYPEVAILGLSKSSLQPVVRDGQIVPRLMMPMSLTYDHRVIDGADGARFTTRLSQFFSDPIRLLMEG